MRLLAAVFTFTITLAVAPAASAQAGWGMSDAAAGNVGEIHRQSPTYRYWEACLAGDADAAVHGCGRIIGARISREHTATAHYFRSIAYRSLGQDRRAERDLRRAYFTFYDIVFEEERNALALYGKGLSLIRMGHQAEGQADLDRAIAMSEGRASQFFEISG